MRKIYVGVSSCLLGNKVRFDGGHMKSAFVTEELGQFFQLKPYCPEMAIGLGAPRNTIRLVKRKGGIRLVGSATGGNDVTEKMLNYSRWAAKQMQELSGFVFKKDSPSCGMERVRLYDENNTPKKETVGMFARQVMKENPLLPVEEEGRLNDPVLRDNFVERVYVYSSWQQLMEGGLTVGRLMSFHSRHKYLLLSRGQVSYQTLGRMVASANRENLLEVASEYVCLLMKTLTQPATRKHHANTLQHLLGYFKNKLDASEKDEVVRQIDQYRKGTTPLLVPMTLLRFMLRRFPNDYLEKQVYFSPHPEQLRLRNLL